MTITQKIIASPEQERVAEYLQDSNVIVNSNPGCGKTTTALFIAKKFLNKRILLVTYSAHLKMETRQKLNKNNIDNIEAHSYHSFVRKYYSRDCSTDFELDKVLRSTVQQQKHFHFDIVMIDECQDMTELYFKTIQRLLKDNPINPRVCLLGDELQNIYGYKGADARYLTLGNRLFVENSLWQHTSLSMSYRVTCEIADFINKCMYKNQRQFPIQACKHGDKPSYYLTNTYTTDLMIIIFDLLKDYTPGDIFVLAPSLRSKNSPIRKLENAMKAYKPEVAIFIPDQDDETLTEQIIHGKIVFATFHQSKGRERAVTIILNFDASYTTFYNRHPENQIRCPNELNVACSRSTEKLLLIHDRRYDPLPFLDVSALKDCVEMYGLGDDNNKIIKSDKQNKNNRPSKTISASDFARFASHNFLKEFESIVRVVSHTSKESLDLLPLIPSAKFNHYGQEIEEPVANLIGATIPIIFEYHHTNQSRCFQRLQKRGYLDSKKREFTHRHTFPNHITEFQLRDWLALANVWSHHLSKYVFRLYQINNYNFADEKFFNKCHDRLKSLNISSTCCLFEDSFSVSDIPHLPNVVLSCSIDCMDHYNNRGYEFKCVDKITIDHILQVAIYMFADLHRDSISTDDHKQEKDEKQWFIFNMRSNELLEISFNCKTDLIDIIHKLYKERYENDDVKVLLSDDEFVSLQTKN